MRGRGDRGRSEAGASGAGGRRLARLGAVDEHRFKSSRQEPHEVGPFAVQSEVGDLEAHAADQKGREEGKLRAARESSAVTVREPAEAPAPDPLPLAGGSGVPAETGLGGEQVGDLGPGQAWSPRGPTSPIVIANALGSRAPGQGGAVAPGLVHRRDRAEGARSSP